MIDKKLSLMENCTENDCLLILERSTLNDTFKGLYRQVNASWVRLAYAHCEISERQLSQLIDFSTAFLSEQGDLEGIKA